MSFYGLYRGTVLDTKDPTGKKRLKVAVPSINGNEELGWALPCFPFLTQQPVLVATTATGGDAYHSGHPVTGKTELITIRLPKRNDPVWVMFEHGDPNKPVWLGSWIGV